MFNRRLLIAMLLLAMVTSASLVQALEPIIFERQEMTTQIPSPRDVIGFEPGEDRRLADWSHIVDYFKQLDLASNRVSVQQLGLSTELRPFIMAIISSEENIQNLARIRQSQRKLADPRLIADANERERLIQQTPVVLAITCSIHSTEIVASQMAMALAYHLASDNSSATQQMMRNVVLLLVPSVNPDGIDIVTDWYRKTLGTKFEGTSPPVLYHHYAGHDNNRDWFMLTQVETQLISKAFWREWFPEIVYDVHQMGSFGARMFAPPFFDPPNPNIDPVILRQVGALGMKMALNLTAAGYKGIVTNSTYDTWWHGGLRTAPYYHNSVGILTEAASARIATPIEIKREQLRDATRGLQNPLITATNFPIAWEGGTWRMRDILDMELITTRTAIEEAALHREEFVRNFVATAERAIEAGKNRPPYAYIVPAEQHDPPTAARMINILIQQGIEVHRARSDFNAGGKAYKAGSYVILLAQPYRANIKCLFEAQNYPDRRLYPAGPAEPPYDVAGWTLPMQMGVDYAEAAERFDAELERIESADPDFQLILPTLRRPTAIVLYLSPNANNAFAFLNDLLKSSEVSSVWRLKQPLTVSERNYPAGTLVIQYTMPKAKSAAQYSALLDMISVLAAKHQVSALAVAQTSEEAKAKAALEAFSKPRIALYRSWVPSIDEGWTRWVLEQFGFDYKSIYDADLRGSAIPASDNLKKKFDVIILPDQSAQQIIDGNRPGTYPPEYTGGIGEEGIANLRSFVEAGGVLICLDSASEFAIKRFDLPIKNVLEGLRRDQFYAPGSIFRAKIDTSHPIAWGMPAEADLYFVSSTRRAQSASPDALDQQTQGQRRDASTAVSAFAFEITDTQRARSVARYIEANPLRSGWLLGPGYIAGKSALVDVSLGEGHIVLFGFRTQHRAQTWGTFKLLFNSILLGGMASNR
jgi:hypothetical protein